MSVLSRRDLGAFSRGYGGVGYGGENKARIKPCYSMGEMGKEWTEEDERAYLHLSGRAFASLDEHGETDLMKKRGAVEKRLAKLGIGEDLSNREEAKRFLLLFADLETTYKAAAKKAGIGLVDLHAAFAMWPEGKMVRDYLLNVKKDLTRVQDIEDLRAARETIRAVMKDAKSGGDSKAAMFVMSKLDKERFGEDPKVSAADVQRAKAQVVYNLPGLTLNMINAPKDMVLRLEKADEKPVINL